MACSKRHAAQRLRRCQTDRALQMRGARKGTEWKWERAEWEEMEEQKKEEEEEEEREWKVVEVERR